MRIRKDINFISCFDEKTGEYIRSGIIEDGRDTGEDPFRASFPELLDVGIMVLFCKLVAARFVTLNDAIPA